MRRLLALALLPLMGWINSQAAEAILPPVRVLFLGDQGHHQPGPRFAQVKEIFSRRNIQADYTENLTDLNPSKLSNYDVLAIYANHDAIGPQQSDAIRNFVEDGKGLVPIHCASYCFRNSDDYVRLVGAQFQRHGMDLVTTSIAAPKNALMAGFGGFDSWDETYVHTRHNPENRVILETRKEGSTEEPWTWTRTQGKGRVFYTAWGHDARTWGHPGFQNLLERGIRWAAFQEPALAGAWNDHPSIRMPSQGDKDFSFIPGKLPFYPASDKWGTMGAPIMKMQAALSPEKSMGHIAVPQGFHLELFASEPQIQGKPIAMTWDEKGRLWISETVDYPNELQEPGKGRDRIRICEDTDGDGRADKFTVFADKLSIPTSLTFANGGLIVHQAPETLFLKDTNGDDKADVRQVLFSGWGTRDTHAGPSNLNYGLDNWIYGILGYSGFEGKIGGEPIKFSTGFYRFRPDGSKMEFLRNTSNNSWGVGISEEGVLFGSTANNNPSVHMPIPNRFYEQVRGYSSKVLPMISETARMYPITEKVRQMDHHGKFTAGAGHSLYTAREYPREYWNRAAFVTEPTGHLAATFLLEPLGATYTSRNSWNLFAGNDEWVAPVVAEVGPDGSVWVADWYNIIVQHNPTPEGYVTGKGNAYETDLRDKKRARIYRVVYGDKPGLNALSLAGASPSKLVETLKHTNMFWRKHAQRLLVERGQRDVVPALAELVKNESIDSIGQNTAAIHALWTLQGLGSVESQMDVVKAALEHPSAGVRKAAVDVLPRQGESGRQLLTESNRLNDGNLQVRLSAILAMAEMESSSEAAAAVVKALNQPENLLDPVLADALISALARHDAPSLAQISAGGSLAKVRSGEQGKALGRILTIFGEHLGRGAQASQAVEFVKNLAKADPATAEPILSGFVNGWPARVRPADSPELGQALAKLLDRQTPAGKGRVVKLAKTWGSASLATEAKAIADLFLKQAADSKLGESDRLEAAAQWLQLRGDDRSAVASLLELVTPQTDSALAEGLIQRLTEAASPETGEVVLEKFAGWTPSARRSGMAVLLSRTDWTQSLLDSIQSGNVPLTDLALDQRTALANHPDKRLAGRARSLIESKGGLPSADRQKVIEQLASISKTKGNSLMGKKIFENNCAKCHRHSGSGNQVGPDLTGMAVHPKEELAIHILDPSRSVEGNFRAYTVATTDGRVLTGLLASESKTAIELLDAEAKTVSLPRSEIEQLAGSAKSLMPEGFEKTLSEKDLTDLLEFLTQKGRWLPLSIDKIATAISTKGLFHEGDEGPDRIILKDWNRREVKGVPFDFVDPRGKATKNLIMLNGPLGTMPPKMPKSVTLPLNAPIKSLNLISGVSGWGFPASGKGSVSMIVRLTYADGTTEDHKLINGEHFADYIRRVDVPGSDFAFSSGGQQLRYLKVVPKRAELVKQVELIKGSDTTSPMVLAITAELPEGVH
ncbi:MAG: ThuA domain-containing protein [Planctomycetota bacterium]|nr:ThuA domain-containing protein [Planctomycetota bacterium]